MSRAGTTTIHKPNSCTFAVTSGRMWQLAQSIIRIGCRVLMPQQGFSKLLQDKDHLGLVVPPRFAATKMNYLWLSQAWTGASPSWKNPLVGKKNVRSCWCYAPPLDAAVWRKSRSSCYALSFVLEHARTL